LYRFLKVTGITLLSMCLMGANTDELKLPNLGESSTSLFSSEKEYQIGRAWLRIFRSRAPTSDDPLLSDYLENLIYRLATHSQLEDRRIDIVIVRNETLNAFAVPGGVMGIHDGLLAYAQSEDELATVLAHELAHLSQRHFSRGVEQQKLQTPLALAGMLAGLLLIATTGGDAGMAAITASQAASMQSRLRFSRGNEQEADRIGMLTMVSAGMDPHAAPVMFERMLKAARYSGNNVPEFLLTHPITENRISDTRNRARRYVKTMGTDNIEYHLMRARVRLLQEDSPQIAIQRFRTALSGETVYPQAERYGLVLALTEARQLDEARKELLPLLATNPESITYIIAAHIAEEVLISLSKSKPKEPAVWYQLAETQGLAGNIPGLHQSRAEYYILNGVMDKASQQLQYALKLKQGSFAETETIKQRLIDIEAMKQMMENL